MELTRQPRFLVVLHDKDDRVVKQIGRAHEALDLAVDAATTAPRKEGQYTAVYAQVGVSR